ncbi:hypothetical protein CS022_23635, partial [Veronia nyctiphanis]
MPSNFRNSRDLTSFILEAGRKPTIWLINPCGFDQHWSTDTRTSSTRVKDFVGERLPYYMVPDLVCVLDTLPLTANGKLDRQAMTTLAEAQVSENDEYVAPTSLREEVLCQLFGELLGLEQVGVHDNFFRLGGSSVDAVKLQSLIRERLGQEMSLQLLFEQPTVSELSQSLIQKTEIEEFSVVDDPSRHDENFPLNDIQYAYWVGQQDSQQLGG